jgi:hypothetical protein
VRLFSFNMLTILIKVSQLSYVIAVLLPLPYSAFKRFTIRLA